MNKRYISVVIPTYNRFRLTTESVNEVLHDDRVSEIVIVDDCSTDDSYENLVKYYEYVPKVALFQNDQNLDCYRNKMMAVMLASNDWVILLDSDNKISKTYLDELFCREWSEDTVYMPEFARPQFDYREFSGLTVDRKNINSYLGKGMFDTMLNCMNYFVNRDKYIEVWDDSVNPHTADSIYQNYRWFTAGYKMYVTPGLQYDHLVHKDSHYQNNNHKTGNFYDQVINKIKSL
jgi:glycosyltransferase involved in cell wall biosynthesis